MFSSSKEERIKKNGHNATAREVGRGYDDIGDIEGGVFNTDDNTNLGDSVLPISQKVNGVGIGGL